VTEPIFYKNEQEAIENAGISYGTGFFISNKGEIATNRHVVYPNKSTTYIADEINDYLNELRREIKKLINDEQRESGKLADYYNEYYDYLDFDRKSQIRESYASKKNKIVELEKYLDEIDFNPNNTSTELKRIFLGIAYDDTHVTSFKDFSECVAIKKSDVEEIDLAIIQLKNKTTPTNISQYFKIEDIKSKDLNLNDDVFMIGFNQGIILANTKNGIKSQFTQGNITQDPDQDKILYSIPTLPGSSGSPIIDKWGNLVAINFLKTRDYQGFSFGIPSIALHNLYNDKPIQVFQKESQIAYNPEPKIQEKGSPDNNVSNNKETIKVIDFSKEIKGFIKAEEKRDFDLIYSFFSPHFSRYYDITNPSYSKLKERYEYLWGFTSNSKNSIQSIDRINDFTYDIRTIFSYYNRRKNKNFTTNSTVRFLFDSNGKIVETYGVTNDTPKPTEYQKNTSSSNDLRNNTNSYSQKNSANYSKYNGYYKFITTFVDMPFEVPLRSEPNMNSQEVYKCPKNATIYVIESSGDTFFKVYVNGYKGYLTKAVLKRKW
jgi:hypothetical protein